MRLLLVFSLALTAGLVAGCNKEQAAATDPAMELPDFLAEDGEASEFDADEPEAPKSRAGKRVANSEAAAEEPQPATRQRDPKEAHGELKLKLEPGEMFPMRKRIITGLVSTATDGTETKIQTELRLLMAITVEDVAGGRTRLGVKYNRVELDQDMDGQRLEYRSTNPPDPVPLAALAYHNMVNDGFSFWIGKDNQINEPVGFHEFTERCLANIPLAQQKQVLMNMEAGTDENGIADFVDNAIGLLPFNVEVSPGYTWSRHRSVQRPVPMVIQNQYTLQELTDSEAIVKITGEILPSQTANKVINGSDSIQVFVTGGRTYGDCIIFRDTGLPKESNTERTIDMVVDLGNGLEFKQTKTVSTRVEAFPAAR